MMTRVMLLALPLTFCLACASGGAPPADDSGTATKEAGIAEPVVVPDAGVGLAAGTAFEQPVQEPIGFNTAEPGDSELKARPNSEFPPVIPHSIEGLETISRTDNACLACHDAANASDVGATPVPASHAVDLRRSPEKQGDEVVGARWVCTSCHVEQTDATPLVAIGAAPFGN